MKLAMALSCVVFIDVAQASCPSLLQDGRENTEKANRFATYSNDHLASMQALIKSGANNKDICSEGQDTRMGAFQAAKSFQSARDSYLAAIKVCPSPTDSSAARDADTVTSHYNTNASLVAQFDSMLGKNCNANPLTPLLNAP
jgi:hypothetical protein